MADKSVKIASTFTNPLVKPLSGSVRVIDDYAAEKIRQIEAKYPLINTPTEKVMNTLNEKTEPVRNVVNSVKDTTTLTIQNGKKTVSNVATATVNKATDVADTVYTFCETHVPGKTIPVNRNDFGRRTTLLWERIKSIIGLQIDSIFQFIQFIFIWFRMLIVSFLLKIKQINDIILTKIQQKPFLSILSQRLLISTSIILEYIITRIQPDDRMDTKQQYRTMQQKNQFISRPTLKPNSFVTTRQNVVVTKEETIINRNGNQECLTDDQQMFHTKMINSDLEKQDDLEEDNYNQ